MSFVRCRHERELKLNLLNGGSGVDFENMEARDFHTPSETLSGDLAEQGAGELAAAGESIVQTHAADEAAEGRLDEAFHGLRQVVDFIDALEGIHNAEGHGGTHAHRHVVAGEERVGREVEQFFVQTNLFHVEGVLLRNLSVIILHDANASVLPTQGTDGVHTGPEEVETRLRDLMEFTEAFHDSDVSMLDDSAST